MIFISNLWESNVWSIKNLTIAVHCYVLWWSRYLWIRRCVLILRLSNFWDFEENTCKLFALQGRLSISKGVNLEKGSGFGRLNTKRCRFWNTIAMVAKLVSYIMIWWCQPYGSQPFKKKYTYGKNWWIGSCFYVKFYGKCIKLLWTSIKT